MPKFVGGFADTLEMPAGSREVQVFDDDLPGFGIRKFESGKASYFVKFRVGQQQRRLTLGKAARGNLRAMRLEASKILSKARLGMDAAAEKKAATAKPQSVTLGEIVPKYLARAGPRTRPKPRRCLAGCCTICDAHLSRTSASAVLRLRMWSRPSSITSQGTRVVWRASTTEQPIRTRNAKRWRCGAGISQRWSSGATATLCRCGHELWSRARQTTVASRVLLL